MTSRNQPNIRPAESSHHHQNRSLATDQKRLTLERKAEIFILVTQLSQASYGLFQYSEHVKDVFVNVGELIALRIEELQMQLSWFISASEQANPDSGEKELGTELIGKIREISALLKELDKLELEPQDWESENLQGFLEIALGRNPAGAIRAVEAVSKVIGNNAVATSARLGMDQSYRRGLEHRKSELECRKHMLDREDLGIKSELRSINKRLSVLSPPPKGSRDNELDDIDRMLLGHDLDESDSDTDLPKLDKMRIGKASVGNTTKSMSSDEDGDNRIQDEGPGVEEHKNDGEFTEWCLNGYRQLDMVAE